jgi:hypothetical protein
MNDSNAPVQRDTLLTLLFPADIEEVVIDLLLEHPEWAGGFTCALVEGHGAAMQPRDPAERVRGRSRRFQVQIALNQDQASALIAHFRMELANPDVAYWTVPLTRFGRLS